MTDVVVPALGESITEGLLSQWLVADGEAVAVDQPIYELDTDKISTEVQAPVAGVLRHKAAEGDTVEIGAVIAVIEAGVEGAEGAAAASAPTPAASPESTTTAAPAAPAAPTPAAPAPAASAGVTGKVPPMAPVVKQLVADNMLDPSTIPATGVGGRLLKKDVEAYMASQKPAAAVAATPPASDEPHVTRKKMTPLRKKIAQRLVQAQQTAAILTTFNEVDMSFVIALRNKFKSEFEEVHETRLGFMSFFSKAVVAALRKYPLINAQIEGDEIVEYNDINLGIAVGTPKGLMVPVLKQAQDMSYADIEAGIRMFAKKARDGKIGLDDLAGGTFTISNGGAYGSLLSTPILNPPQSGILGMHGIQQRPIAVDGEVVIRPMMYIALSYDHRIVDGAEAVGFLVRIKELIEAPERLLFDL